MEQLKQQVDAVVGHYLHSPTVLLLLIIFALVFFALGLRRDSNLFIVLMSWFLFLNVMTILIYALYFLPSLTDKVNALQSKIVQLELFLNKDTKTKAAYEVYQKVGSMEKRVQTSEAQTKAYKQLIDQIAEANIGQPQAQFNVGLHYYNGSAYIHKDVNQALVWVKRAGSRGYPQALFWLGRYYQQDVSDNGKALACYWMSLAAHERHEEATIEAPKLCLSLSGDVQSAIRDNVQAWKPVK